MSSKLFLVTYLFAGLISWGCSKEFSGGTLNVRFVNDGTYEIYKIANENPVQFVSEMKTNFNEKVFLQPGSYMILADCSSQIINIYPGSDVILVANKINFIPLQAPKESDKFSIQCVRSDKTHSRQNLLNHFSLAVLSGSTELLVGMLPLKVDLPVLQDSQDPGPSKVLSHVLSYISVNSTGQMPLDDFFVSPVGGISPFTESQKPGSKLFVLKGKYDLQLNGTEMTIDLAEGGSRTVSPGTLTITTSANADLQKAERVRGAPIYAEVNGEHYMNLNTSYPVLPGSVNVRLATSLRAKSFEITEGQNLKIHARNVLVDLNCAQDDWACLGSKKVKLFEADKNFHFAESQTDVPVLFFEKDVAIGVEGSRNIKLNLNSSDDQRVKLGFLEVVPTPVHRPGMLTDLMRVETSGNGMVGSSLDMVLDKPTVMPLIAGQYHLSEYTFFTSDGSRRKSSQSFYIAPGQHVKLEVQTFLTEKRMSLISGDQDDVSKQ